VECRMMKCVGGCGVYKKDEMGCQTCECEGDKCGEMVCEAGQICAARVIDLRSTRICAPKPLCHSSRETGGQYGGFATDCEPSGAFRPTQCVAQECWCVDDRGVEIDGTRVAVINGDNKPSCVRNITVAMTVRMLLVVDSSDAYSEEKDSRPHMDQLTKNLPEHISTWMLIDRQYITIVHVDERPSDDEHEDGSMLVELYIRYDGTSDLPSAMEHMKRRMHTDRCRVPYGSSGVLVPQPETVEAEHKFSAISRQQRPQLGNLENGLLYHEKQSGFVSCLVSNYKVIVIGAAVIIGCIAIIIIMLLLIRRRHMRSRFSFERQRFANQLSTNSEKSLLGSRDDNVLLVSSEPIDDKTALA